MSDTPETDAKIICSTHRSFKGVGGVVVSEFCRKLERERDEAREIIRMAKTKFCEEGSDGNIASDMFAILSSGGIAQWLEQSAHNRLVVGSNPSAPTL